MRRVDALREIEKIELALKSSQLYFERNSEANAALHGSSKIIYSPIVTLINEAQASLDALKNSLED